MIGPLEESSNGPDSRRLLSLHDTAGELLYLVDVGSGIAAISGLAQVRRAGR